MLICQCWIPGLSALGYVTSVTFVPPTESGPDGPRPLCCCVIYLYASSGRGPHSRPITKDREKHGAFIAPRHLPPNPNPNPCSPCLALVVLNHGPCLRSLVHGGFSCCWPDRALSTTVPPFPGACFSPFETALSNPKIQPPDSEPVLETSTWHAAELLPLLCASSDGS